MSGRGLAQKSKGLIQASYEILEQIQPASVRAVCYQLFTRGIIASMKTSETQKVSKQLVYARENGIIPWEWIVDETRTGECYNTWGDLSSYGRTVVKGYRKDFWRHQNETVEVWSEKGTVRGVLKPVLDEFAVEFHVKHGFDSATLVNDVADRIADLDRPLIAFYVGDWDPSGLWMSERDLPERLARYGANVNLIRIALDLTDVLYGELPKFSADTKIKDPRHKWFVDKYGPECWELDALSPALLRNRVREAITDTLDMDAWAHCKKVEDAELASLKGLDWKRLFSDQSQNTEPEGGLGL
jgi:hypothetical protein